VDLKQNIREERSGRNFSQHAAKNDVELPEKLGGMC